MKFLSLLFAIGVGIYFFDQSGPWTKEKKNSEIAYSMKKYAKKAIQELKREPYIADANIKHDKKNCGLIFYVKMADIQQKLSKFQISQLRIQLQADAYSFIRQKNDPEIEELRSIIKKGIYVMYRYYLNNGKVFATVKLTKKNI